MFKNNFMITQNISFAPKKCIHKKRNVSKMFFL